jgi:hypothetical protein
VNISILSKAAGVSRLQPLMLAPNTDRQLKSDRYAFVSDLRTSTVTVTPAIEGACGSHRRLVVHRF